MMQGRSGHYFNTAPFPRNGYWGHSGCLSSRYSKDTLSCLISPEINGNPIYCRSVEGGHVPVRKQLPSQYSAQRCLIWNLFYAVFPNLGLDDPVRIACGNHFLSSCCHGFVDRKSTRLNSSH